MAGDFSLVTEYWLNLSLREKSGVTPGFDNELAMDWDQIVSRYWVDPNETGNRCPSQNELSNVPALSISFVDPSPDVLLYPPGTVAVYFTVNYQPYTFEYLGVCWAPYPTVPSYILGSHYDDHVADVPVNSGIYMLTFLRSSNPTNVRVYGQYRNTLGNLIEYYSDMRLLL
jgi:hypothetical protein